jgi:predicted O-linked N-acetylglucosamine transferase (SPINDLY family)
MSSNNQDKLNIVNNYKKYFNEASTFISNSLNLTNIEDIQKCRLHAIKAYETVLKNVDIVDYLLIDSTPIISHQLYTESLFNLATLYKMYADTLIENKKLELQKSELNRKTNGSILLSRYESELYQKSLNYLSNILRVNFEDENALTQVVSIYTNLCFFSQDTPDKSLFYLNQALLFAPQNPTIHYNLGYIYQNQNKIEQSLIHYKLSLALLESVDNKTSKSEKEKIEQLQLKINNLNGISSIFRNIKQWPEALYYSRKAEKLKPDDPNIQNQLGVIYTEMRRTDLAEIAYKKAIDNYQKSFVSTDKKFLLSELHLNFGHMHSYNGDNNKAIEMYNKSLQICPNFTLPFQNKLMNLSYIFDQLEDKIYIYNQHKLVNKLYKRNTKFTFDKKYFETEKLNIGIISGDFIEHPVSFFISTFLQKYSTNKINLTCYSECIINTEIFNTNINFKLIKNLSAKDASQMIHNDNIHILFDLAGHTAFNRLDIFALKPAPIQISYIGYPYSTGLNEMDYRITDSICDKNEISQKFYTEKLLYLKNCFLCYNPNVIKRTNVIDDIPELTKQQPFIKNKYLTIACFNRVNKITDDVISFFNDILLRHSNIKFIFKTKALLNKSISEKFVNKFDKSVHNRITIIDCTILHEHHLLEYNKADIAIDTFPYSGTTTSCESLYMGVPVFTLYDTKYFFHPQNVTASILKNSDLDYYILNSKDDIHDKLNELSDKDNTFWSDFKQNIRNKFLNGKVCNSDLYIENLESLLFNIFDSTKSNYK